MAQCSTVYYFSANNINGEHDLCKLSINTRFFNFDSHIVFLMINST